MSVENSMILDIENPLLASKKKPIRSNKASPAKNEQAYPKETSLRMQDQYIKINCISIHLQSTMKTCN